MFDSSLRTPFVHAIAIRYQTPLWKIGALLRGACVAGLWLLLLLWFPHQSWPKDAAMLAVATTGAVASWAHNRSSLLEFLVDRNLVGLGRVAWHLRRARERATADLAGLLDGFGIISAGLLFAGPLQVRPLPAVVYGLGLVLITVHVWSVSRLTVLGRASELGSVELLWRCVTRTLPSGGTMALVLDPASHAAQLTSTDYQLARRCLMDLLTNAWKAGATRIDVAISVNEMPESTRTHTVLQVDDDGPGMPEGVLSNPTTSLAVMAGHLRGYAGSLAFYPRPGGGTRACAQWQSGW